MLKRRGNFPYDFDAAFPDCPIPVMPPNYVHNPAPPSAPPAAAPPATDPPLPPPPSQPTSSAPSAPQSPEIKTEAPKTSPRKLPRRSHHFKPRPRKISAPSAPPPSNSLAAHHAPMCSICNHPNRRAIEDDFIHWVRPSVIAWEFDISARAICRHARAIRLYDLRAEKYIEALDLVVENAQGAAVNGDMILRAIRAATHFRASGQWAEPPKRVIYSIEHDPASAIAPPEPATAFASASPDPILELAPPVASEPRETDSQNHLDHDASH